MAIGRATDNGQNRDAHTQIIIIRFKLIPFLFATCKCMCNIKQLLSSLVCHILCNFYVTVYGQWQKCYGEASMSIYYYVTVYLTVSKAIQP